MNVPNTANNNDGMGTPGQNYDPATKTGYDPANSSGQTNTSDSTSLKMPTSTTDGVTGTSDSYRSGLTDLQQSILDGYSKNLSMLSDTSGLTKAEQDQNTTIQNERDQMKLDEQNSESGINTSYDGKVTDANQKAQQDNGKTSMYLSRIGGALGNGTAGAGVMENLNQTHIKQINTLEAARVNALNTAKTAYNNKDFALAKEQNDNAAKLETEIQAAHKEYASTALSYLNSIKSAQTADINQQAKTAASQQKARDFALKNGISQPFYSIDGQTIINSKTGEEVPIDKYKASGKGDGSDVQLISGNPVKFETKNIGGQLVHIGYNAQGQEVTRSVLGQSGKGGSGGGGGKVTSADIKAYNSKADAAFDQYTGKATNPNRDPLAGPIGDSHVSPENFNEVADDYVKKGMGTYKQFYAAHSQYANPRDVKAGKIKGAPSKK